MTSLHCRPYREPPVELIVAAGSRVVSAGIALISLLLGGCSSEESSSGPPAPQLLVGRQGVGDGRFQFPRAITVDPKDGRFWVVDRVGRIQLFSRTGEPVAGWRIPKTDNGAPVGMELDRDGTLLVMDSHYQRVLRYRDDGSEILSRFGSLGKGRGQFTFGRDVVVDSEGNIFAGDYGGSNDRVQKFASDGRFLLEWGRQGSAEGEFNKMQGMTIERRRNAAGEVKEFLLVADQCNHRIQRFDLEGNFVSSFGSMGREVGKLRFPSSIAVGSDGSLYVSEWGNNRVQKFDRDGNSLGVWGGPGDRPGQLKTPWDVEVGPDDRIYVVDYGNHRVQVFVWGDDEPVTASSYRGETERADGLTAAAMGETK